MTDTEPIIRKMKAAHRKGPKVAKLTVVPDEDCKLRLYVDGEFVGMAICEKQIPRELWRLHNWDINSIIDERKRRR